MTRRETLSKNSRNYHAEFRSNKLRILIPTICKESSIADIVRLTAIFDNQLNITFLHVVPLSPEELYDCVDHKDIGYAKSVAEKKLYSYINKIPKEGKSIYSYKITNGRSKEEIIKIIREGQYDFIALQVGEISHYSNSIFDIIELVNSLDVSVIIFGSRNPGLIVNQISTEVV